MIRLKNLSNHFWIDIDEDDPLIPHDRPRYWFAACDATGDVIVESAGTYATRAAAEAAGWATLERELAEDDERALDWALLVDLSTVPMFLHPVDQTPVLGRFGAAWAYGRPQRYRAWKARVAFGVKVKRGGGKLLRRLAGQLMKAKRRRRVRAVAA